MRLDNPKTRQFGEVVESDPKMKWLDEVIGSSFEESRL